MVRDHDLREGIGSSKNHVASALAHNDKAGFFQGDDAFAAGDDRKRHYTANKTASKVSSGTGRLSSDKAWM